MKKINFILSVTEYCNFNCDYCIEKVQNSKNGFNDFDIADSIKTLERVVYENQDKKILLSFFGGEPTLKKDKIIKFLDILKSYDFFEKIEFEITTNCFIYFPELIEFCNSNNKKLRLTISYDSVGQNNRTKDKNVINVVENNIIKYSKLFKQYSMHEYCLTVNCCVTENNADTIYSSFMDILFNKNVKSIVFSTVFTEYWNNSSFEKLFKEYKKIYEFVIKNNKIHNKVLYSLPSIGGTHQDYWRKYNPLFYQSKNDKNVLKEVNYADCTYHETFERRYNNKKTYSIKPLNIDKQIEIVKDIELLTLRYASSNYYFFDKLTMQLLLGDNIKKYKKEIYCLFSFNIFLCNQYKKIIKRLINDNIDFFQFLNKYSFTILLNKDELKKFLNHKNIKLKIEKDKIIIDEFNIPIRSTGSCIGVFFKNNICYVNNNFIKDNKLNYIKLLNKEICRYVLQKHFTISNELETIIVSNFYKFLYDNRR